MILFLEGHVEKAGFYIIKNEFFEIMSDPYLKWNKGENSHIIIALKKKIKKYTG